MRNLRWTDTPAQFRVKAESAEVERSYARCGLRLAPFGEANVLGLEQ